MISAVQGHSQIDLGQFSGQFLHAGNNAAGGNGKMAEAEIKTGWVMQSFDGQKNIGRVQQRFAHAHENDIGYRLMLFLQEPAEKQNLINDFRAGQIALEADFSSGAELAAQRTAGLGGNADGAALVSVLHQDGFDFSAVRQGEERFVGAAVMVLKNLASDCQRTVLMQFGLEFLGEIGGLLPVAGQILENDLFYLLQAVSRLALEQLTGLKEIKHDS